MNYIVLDLEWNQCPYGKARENKKLPFEIIEFGAVKMNEKKEIIDTFHQLVRPVVYRKIHFRTREVIAVSMRDLERDGILFPKAAEAFFKWCGDDCRFCTWGTLDLTELQRNLDFYYMDGFLAGPVFYEDVQKLFAITYETRKERRSLEYAVDFLKVEDAGEFHQALDDAVYTAKVLGTIPDDVIRENFSVDTYCTPKTKDEQILIRYSTYEKFISREFPTKELAMEDREVTSLRCFVCHRNAKKRVKWFSDNGKNHYAVGYCPEHGYVKSKVRLRKSDSGRIFVIKTTKMITESDAAKIRGKQEALRERRHKQISQKSHKKQCMK